MNPIDHHRAQIQTINTRLDSLRAYKQKSNSKLIKDRINVEIDSLQAQKHVHQNILDSLMAREDRKNDETRKNKAQALKDRGISVEVDSVCGNEKCTEENPCQCCFIEEMEKEQATDEEIKTVLNL